MINCPTLLVKARRLNAMPVCTAVYVIGINSKEESSNEVGRAMPLKEDDRIGT
jgi:hypothetical protein